MRHVQFVRLLLLLAFVTGCASSHVPGDDTLDGGGDPDARWTPDAAPPPDASSDANEATCRDGRLEEFEVCDPTAGNVTPEQRCDCNDNDPCTLDRCAQGTSADTCDCHCEHVPQYDHYGVGTCNDGNACTNDVIHCGPGFPPGDMSCANTCAIASCQNDPIAGCTPGCGNGVLDAWETCDDSTGNPAQRCSCDDGDPCTIDMPTGGNPSTCTLTCLSPHPLHTGFGYTTCDDGRSCTTDVITSGTPDPATCQIGCSNAPISGWEVAQCAASDLACVHYTPIPSSADPSTCRVDCIDHLDTTWLSSVCNDGLPCTTDAIASYDTTHPLDPATCDAVCNHTLDGSWYSGQVTACAANRPACLVFAPGGFSYDATSPTDPATCDADCHLALDPAWLAATCNDGDACTSEAPAFLETAAQIDAAHSCPAEVAYTCGRHDRRGDLELCNGSDDDCDGAVDDGGPAGIVPTNPVAGTAFGGSGGSAFTLACPNNTVLVGIDGRAGSRVDAITPVCAPLQVTPAGSPSPEYAYAVHTGTATTMGTVGGTGGSVFSARCPADQVVIGMTGRSGDNIDRIGIGCGALSITRVASSWLLVLTPASSTDSYGGSGGSPFSFACPAGQAATGATGRAGDRVDKFGFVCSRLSLAGVADVTYELVARHSSKCLNVEGISTADGGVVDQWTCASVAQQHWTLQSTGDGYARLVAQHSGKCLDVPHGSTSSGAALEQYSCNEGTNQRFSFVDLGNGYVHVVPLSSGGGLCLDVAGGSSADQAAVLQYTCAGAGDSFNQQWQLRKVP